VTSVSRMSHSIAIADGRGSGSNVRMECFWLQHAPGMDRKDKQLCFWQWQLTAVRPKLQFSPLYIVLSKALFYFCRKLQYTLFARYPYPGLAIVRCTAERGRLWGHVSTALVRPGMGFARTAEDCRARRSPAGPHASLKILALA
jgi:hypothetical protein